MSILDGYLSLKSDVNRVKGKDEAQNEGVSSDLLTELSLKITDEELIELKNTWIKDSKDFNAELNKKGEKCEKYWKGEFEYSHLEQQGEDKPEADNLIFESLETFLPLATRQNPDPMITCEDENEQNLIKDELVRLSDTLKFKLKLRDIGRHWALYFVGVGKILWNLRTDIIDFKGVRADKLILDPEAYIEGGRYFGRFIGEYKTESAKIMVEKFKGKADWLKGKVDGKMATNINYIEWWTDHYVFWTLDNTVLDKANNPHWNYEETKDITDEYGAVTPQTQPGQNHFIEPQIPYAFLSVFNIGKHPADDTSLIYQNLYIQDMIHKRLKQIEKNVDNINGGYVVSGEYTGLTEEQAAQAIGAIRKGGAIYVPQGSAESAVAKINGQGLAGDVYQSLVDYRSELRNIFGTRGSSPEGIMAERTVHGKIYNQQSDTSRIGLIAEYIEQFSDYVFNWFVQMMYVYYPPEFTQGLTAPAVVSIKEGSLIPKDELTKRNEAIDLWSAGALAPIDLYKRLEESDAEQLNQDLMQWTQFKAQPIPPPMPAEMPGQVPPTQ